MKNFSCFLFEASDIYYCVHSVRGRFTVCHITTYDNVCHVTNSQNKASLNENQLACAKACSRLLKANILNVTQQQNKYWLFKFSSSMLENVEYSGV